jgi:hypothetical protein
MKNQEFSIGDIVSFNSGYRDPALLLTCEVVRISGTTFDGLVRTAGSHMMDLHPVGEIRKGMAISLFNIVETPFKDIERKEQKLLKSIKILESCLKRET